TQLKRTWIFSAPSSPRRVCERQRARLGTKVVSADIELLLVGRQRAVPHRPLPRLRGRDREGACNMIDVSGNPLPTPPPPAGEGANRARCADVLTRITC